MKRNLCLPIILLSLFFLTSAALADTRYVTDELTINLRRGMGNEFRILRMLPTGTAVQVLETEGNYAKVRSSDGTEGYVLVQYLTRETPKALVAERLERENTRLSQELNQVKESYRDVDTLVNQFKAEIAMLEQARSEAEKGFREFQAKYEKLREDSANVINLQNERDQLNEANQALETEVNALRDMSDKALRTAMIRWFLAGAGVLLTGWILGSISRKKRRTSSLSW